MPPFMAIHYINAYEERGEGDGPAAAVIVDCCEHYGDPAIIETLVLHRLRSFRYQDVLPDARYYTMYMHMVAAFGSRCVNTSCLLESNSFLTTTRRLSKEK